MSTGKFSSATYYYSREQEEEMDRLANNRTEGVELLE